MHHSSCRLGRLLVVAAALSGCTMSSEGDENLGSIELAEVATCDGIWNGVPVAKVPATFPVTQAFVSAHQGPVGFYNGGCTGTLVSDNLFLTAAHCLSNSAGDPGAIVEFNFQDGPTSPATITTVNFKRVVEYQRAIPASQSPADILQDYALLELEGTPGATFGTAKLATADLAVGARVTLIGHHGARAKEVTTGLVRDMSTLYMGHDADIESGISGGSILGPAGTLEAVAFRSGCELGEFNGALKISTLLALSPTLKALSVPAVLLPTTLQGERYVRFSDTDTVNRGAAGAPACSRSDGVDIAALGTGCTVGWTAAGEWLEYDVTSSGARFDLSLRLSADVGSTGKRASVAFNGTKVGAVTVSGTGFGNYADYPIRGVYLAPGRYKLRVTFDTGGVNFDRMGVTQLYSDLPGKIEAERYARFADSDTVNSGAVSSPACNQGDAVDLQTTTDTGGGCNAAWTNAAEWLEYDVSSPGRTFNVSLRLAPGNAASTRRVSLRLDGAPLGSAVTVAANGWQTFGNYTVSGVSIPAGKHKLRVVFESGGVNFNYLSLN